MGAQWDGTVGLENYLQFLKKKNQHTPTSKYLPEEMLTHPSVYLGKVPVPDYTTAPYTRPQQFDCEQPTQKTNRPDARQQANA